MAGILDSKERVQDFILTKRGRQQLSEGRLQLCYATFTDLHPFYKGTEGVVDDASSRLFLEAFQRQQDQIVPPALADGRLLAYGVGFIAALGGMGVLSNFLYPALAQVVVILLSAGVIYGCLVVFRFGRE